MTNAGQAFLMTAGLFGLSFLQFLPFGLLRGCELAPRESFRSADAVSAFASIAPTHRSVGFYPPVR
jgi:hypothetical protein